MSFQRHVQVGDRVRITDQALNLSHYLNETGTVIRLATVLGSEDDPAVFIKLDDHVMPVLTFDRPGWLVLVDE